VKAGLQRFAELRRKCSTLRNFKLATKEKQMKLNCKKLMSNAAAMVFAFQSSRLYAVGLSNVSESSLKDSIGNVIMMISGVAGPIVLAMGLLVGGIKYHNGDEQALGYIKGGVVGGILTFGAWGISKWLFAAF